MAGGKKKKASKAGAPKSTKRTGAAPKKSKIGGRRGAASKKPAPSSRKARPPRMRTRVARAASGTVDLENRTTSITATSSANLAEHPPYLGPNRPSRVITTRPRPPLQQFDFGAGGDGVTDGWQLDARDLADRLHEQAVVTDAYPTLTSPDEVEARIEEARSAGWEDDPRPSDAELADSRVRLTHPHCRYLDGKSVLDVTLAIHDRSRRASLLFEGGGRLRSVSFALSRDEDLPTQISRLLDDPARLARLEHASATELQAELKKLDESTLVDLKIVACAGQDSAIYDRLVVYVRELAELNASFGLPTTVEAAWGRFGVGPSSLIEKLGVRGSARQRVCDLFDSAIDNA